MHEWDGKRRTPVLTPQQSMTDATAGGPVNMSLKL